MPQLAVPQLKKFVYLKSVLPDMRCQLIAFLVAKADRAAAEKVCVPKIGLARHALPTQYIFSHILCFRGCAAYCSGDPLIPLVHAAAPGFVLIRVEFE